MADKLPGARAALVDNVGVTTPPFYRYFQALERLQAGAASAVEVAAINAQIAVINAEIAALPKASFPTLQVSAPLTSAGLLQNGFARLGWKGTTSDVPEGTNKYYTDARADARIAAHDTFPFFASDGSAAYIPLTSDLMLPFFSNDGTVNNIPLAA